MSWEMTLFAIFIGVILGVIIGCYRIITRLAKREVALDEREVALSVAQEFLGARAAFSGQSYNLAGGDALHINTNSPVEVTTSSATTLTIK